MASLAAGSGLANSVLMSLDTAETPSRPERWLISRSISAALIFSCCSRYRTTLGSSARAHNQPVDRGEAHCRGDAAAVLDRAEASAIAEMRDYELAVRDLRRDPQ